MNGVDKTLEKVEQTSQINGKRNFNIDKIFKNLTLRMSQKQISETFQTIKLDSSARKIFGETGFASINM